MTTLKPGSRVTHAVRHKQHDRWEGVVVEIERHERETHQWVYVLVRWVKPDGNPSDGLTGHDPSELVSIPEEST